MSAVVERMVFEDVWQGLYGESWKGLISDDAFAHPAKFSRALIRRIYDHVIDEGWASKNDSVVDPFGGVALGAHDAMRHGLIWYGCELEEKFVGLGSQNIALWNDRFSRMPNWGTARSLQGDSRKLAEVLSAAECCVSSPPYADGCRQTGGEDPKPHYIQSGNKDVLRNYGENTVGQLGAMKEGDLNLAITSPPYARSLMPDMNDPEKYAASEARYKQNHPEHKRPKGAAMVYGNTEGNLGHMREGTVAAAISSPPYIESMERAGGIDATKSRHVGGPHSQMNRSDTRYGTTEGQLGAMPEGQLCVSSPPWEKGAEGFLRKGKFRDPEQFAVEMNAKDGTAARHGCTVEARVRQMERDALKTYGNSDGQMGQESGETFWSASRLILEQLHQVIVPGGHAVFVVKAFVRDKKIVDFPGQWAQLCEAVGFRLVHHHRASLVEHSGTQGGFDQDKEIRVERKSFFRRLAEAKGSPRIDHESVLCFERL